MFALYGYHHLSYKAQTNTTILRITTFPCLRVRHLKNHLVVVKLQQRVFRWLAHLNFFHGGNQCVKRGSEICLQCKNCKQWHQYRQHHFTFFTCENLQAHGVHVHVCELHAHDLLQCGTSTDKKIGLENQDKILLKHQCPIVTTIYDYPQRILIVVIKFSFYKRMCCVSFIQHTHFPNSLIIYGVIYTTNELLIEENS